ncbi:MAG: DUF3108 domain-containing protein [Bdellovibrionaceae bacterium]|nr:DUF3108 domain-containing protein [Bdellovibrio sp.]
MSKCIFILALIGTSCSSKFLKYEKAEQLAKNSEFENKVKIIETPEVASTTPSSDVSTASKSTQASIPITTTTTTTTTIKKTTKRSNTKKAAAAELAAAIPTERQPTLEDNEGFSNVRRPLADPFRVGERVVHSVSYFTAHAGTLTFSVKPYVQVNGRRSYNFVTDIQSSQLFSSFYSAEDRVETYVDYEDLVPHVFKLKIKESGQLKEAQSYFDQQTLKANYWENKYTEKDGHEEKKQAWDLLPYSQNAFSSIYYMRIFKWQIGKEYAFRVSDDGKNVIFKGKALERITLDTKAGQFKAIKIRAEIVSRGALSQTGDLLLWISDDEHRYILRIEAKIKIGTLVSEVTSIHPG